MACIRDKKCAECGETKPVDIHSFNGVCCECLEKKATKARRMFLASLKGLTVEERLENLTPSNIRAKGNQICLNPNPTRGGNRV